MKRVPCQSINRDRAPMTRFQQNGWALQVFGSNAGSPLIPDNYANNQFESGHPMNEEKQTTVITSNIDTQIKCPDYTYSRTRVLPGRQMRLYLSGRFHSLSQVDRTSRGTFS
ncbi:hypothetical protein CEXT_300341, partial [Caerostris extrusa]